MLDNFSVILESYYIEKSELLEQYYGRNIFDIFSQKIRKSERKYDHIKYFYQFGTLLL